MHVAGGSPGGASVAESNRLLNSKPVYMYLENMLIFEFCAIGTSPNSFAKLLSSSATTVSKCLNTNTLFLGTFFLSLERLNDTVDNRMPIDKVRQRVEDARITHGETRVTSGPHKKSPALIIERVSDNKLFHFDSFSPAAV